MSQSSISIKCIPTSLLESVTAHISDLTIGLSKIVGSQDSEDVQLLGSGTLVKAGGVHAILTAQHVLKLLPTTGRLGLILSKSTRRDTIDVQGVSYLDLGRGTLDCEGPDLAVIVLSATIASTVAARKSFYDLDKHRERALTNPPERQYGVWCNIGFIDEKTVEEPGRDGYTKIRGFCLYAGFGGPEDAPVYRDGFDFISMPVTYSSSPGIPKSFGGMSGGGLWQIQLIKKESGIEAGELLLSGVVFYQEALSNMCRNIICHYRESVYKTAYESIKNAAL